MATFINPVTGALVDLLAGSIQKGSEAINGLPSAIESAIIGLMPKNAQRGIYNTKKGVADFAGELAQAAYNDQYVGAPLRAYQKGQGRINAVMGYKQQPSITDNPLFNAMTGSEALTVFHGSPFKFDNFNAAHIGKGEGAQAFGHGLYFAERPEVADSYAMKLGKVSDVSFKNKIPETEAEKEVADRLSRIARSTQSEYRNEMLEKEYKDILFRGDMGIPGDLGKKAKELSSAAKTLGNPDFSVERSLYKADIPDEMIPSMLYLDGILSEQPQAVQDLAKTWGIKPKGTGDVFGNDVMNEAVNRFGGPQGAANALASRGIPGIKYLDGDSRTAMDGSHNYVVFPGMENRVKILERNGRPIK